MADIPLNSRGGSMTDREFVEQHWGDCVVEDHRACCGGDDWRWVCVEGNSGWSESQSSAWRAAAEFTRERLKQIAELTYELSLIRCIHENGTALPAEARNPHDWQAGQDALQRTANRLQQQLTTLRKGMKGEA